MPRQTQQRVPMATLMNYMYQCGLSMAACVAWSSGEHAQAAACVGAAVTSYALARLKLKETKLGVAAVALRETGWQTPAPINRSGTQAGMQGYAERRTQYKEDYEGRDDYFDYYSEVAKGRDRGDGLNQYEFMLAYWLVMMLLPFAVINFCDDRGRHCAFSQLANWSTAECIIRADIFTCEAAMDMMEVIVVMPWTTGAGRYTDKPLFFVNSFSVGQGPRIEGMLAYLPEDNDPFKIRDALKAMAVVYVRSGLAPPHMTYYQVLGVMASVAGFGGNNATKNIGPRSSSSQGICECSRLCLIETTITGEEGLAGEVEVKIHHAPAKTICDIWTVPGALAEAEAGALKAFGETHYAPRRVPWAGGVLAIELSDDEEEETLGAPDVTDAATSSSEQELTPEFLQTMFFAVSLYAVALKSGEVEKVVTAVGAQVDVLVRKDASAARELLDEVKRARSRDRTGGPVDLSKIWDEVERPSWDPASKGFLKRALAAREGLEMTTRDVPKLYDDDRKLIYDPSSSTGFQELLKQYSDEVVSGKAHAKFQKNQKAAGSLEAMYETLAPRKRSRTS
jgi:hypothetical protein